MVLENASKKVRKKRSSAVSYELRSEFYRLHYTEGQTLNTIAKKFGVSSSTVNVNIAKFAAEIKRVHAQTVDMSKLTEAEHIKALEKENKELRKKLAESELHVEFLDAVIDVSEKRFNIPIKKKAGGQP